MISRKVHCQCTFYIAKQCSNRLALLHETLRLGPHATPVVGTRAPAGADAAGDEDVRARRPRALLAVVAVQRLAGGRLGLLDVRHVRQSERLVCRTNRALCRTRDDVEVCRCRRQGP